MIQVACASVMRLRCFKHSASFVKMKRGMEEIADLSCVDHAAQSAKVEGVVTALSPMKKARTGDCQYFNGSFSDGKARVRLYGHNAGAHKKLLLSSSLRDFLGGASLGLEAAIDFLARSLLSLSSVLHSLSFLFHRVARHRVLTALSSSSAIACKLATQHVIHNVDVKHQQVLALCRIVHFINIPKRNRHTYIYIYTPPPIPENSMHDYYLALRSLAIMRVKSHESRHRSIQDFWSQGTEQCVHVQNL